MTKNKLGLTVGMFLAIIHAVWSLFVAVTPAGLQSFIDWIFKLHHIGLAITITPFVFMNAVELVIVTFVIGYIFGWIFGAVMKKVCR